MLLASLLLLAPAPVQSGGETARRPVATYSIVARDPETGALGVAVQSHWFAVGAVVPWARAGVGAVATQSFVRAAYGPELLADLEAGRAPAEALAARLRADAAREVRQVALVDARGRSAAHTGASCIAAAGHHAAEGYSVQANIMRDDGVVPAMAAAYEAAEGAFAERLLQALEGAQAAGGDLRGRQSAALLVVAGERRPAGQGVLLDLRVDDAPRPLAELRRLLRIHDAYAAADRGDAALTRGDSGAAAREYSLAAALLPEQAELAFWQGMTLLELGRREAALPVLRGCFAREPAWLAMPPRLAAAGHLEGGASLLAEIAALAPAGPTGAALRRRAAAADPARIDADIRRLAAFGTRHTLSSRDDPERGIGAARRWLVEAFEEVSRDFHDGRLRVTTERFKVPPGRRAPRGAIVENVVGTLPGRDADRLVVLSGHYDSRASGAMDIESDAPGANDDASGVAAVLEAARLLAGLEPRATLVFLAVSGEEQGLYGSTAQARAWKEQGRTVAAFFTLDIVGGARGSDGVREPWRLRVFSSGLPAQGRVVGSDNDAPSRQLARYLRRAGEAAVPGFEITLVFRQDRYLRGGDHRPFEEEGWPAVRLTEPHENYDWQHQDVREESGVRYGDLPEFVDPAFVARVAGALAAAAGELSLAPPAPARVDMDVRRLTPDTTLRWPEVEGAARYAVLQRRTHEPDWSIRTVVGKVRETTLRGMSKDDWLFAVEAVDEAGHRSLPVYPRPAR